MTLSRVTVNRDVDVRLRNLRGRTGLTPNLLCRLGFCLSLEEPGIPDLELYAGDAEREFNRYTLTGQWDQLFFAMLRERLSDDGLDPEEYIEPQFKAHLSRGVFLLNQRVRSLNDIENLFGPPASRSGDEVDEIEPEYGELDA